MKFSIILSAILATCSATGQTIVDVAVNGNVSTLVYLVFATAFEDNVTKVNGAELVATDILANHGVIHKIDKVLVGKKANNILNAVNDETGAPTVTPSDSGSSRKAGIATTTFCVFDSCRCCMPF
jgi:hypothetical protein